MLSSFFLSLFPSHVLIFSLYFLMIVWQQISKYVTLVRFIVFISSFYRMKSRLWLMDMLHKNVMSSSACVNAGRKFSVDNSVNRAEELSPLRIVYFIVWRLDIYHVIEKHIICCLMYETKYCFCSPNQNITSRFITPMLQNIHTLFYLPI